MITSLEIKGLYGLYNYKLNFVDENPITILTGPNGFGKTTLLKVINHLYNCDFWYFCMLPFHTLYVSFKETNDVVSFIEMSKKTAVNMTEVAEISLEEGKNLQIIYGQHTNEEDMIFEDFLLGDRYYTGLRENVLRRSKRHSVYSIRYKGIDEEKLFESFYSLSSDDIVQRKARNILMFFQDKQSRFIQEQRCMQPFEFSAMDDFELSVNTYSIDEITDSLRRTFDAEQKKYAKISQEVDGTFISRLLNQKTKPSISKETYDERVGRLKSLINRLRRFNLVSNVEFAEKDVEEYHDVLSLHLQDMENKLYSFRNFLQKLELFEGFVAKNVLSNKTMILDNRGIVIVNSSGERVPVRKLSSGEQNLIILYYRLVFETEPDSLLLIDEPENSLHMAWLENMLSDYIEMTNQLGCQLLVATHSPAFINGHWELTYDLFENNKPN